MTDPAITLPSSTAAPPLVVPSIMSINKSKPSKKSNTSCYTPHPHYVDHSYTDYAKVDEDELRCAGALGTSANTKALSLMGSYGPMKNKELDGIVMMPFPGKLLEVLDRGDLANIIDWMPHGRAFIVKQPKLFTTQVLCRFFKQTKYLSFTRQLNLWGFKRITRGIDSGAYYHELFLPGRPNLAMRMKRVKIKGTGIRPIPNPEGEPNFYYDYAVVRRVVQSGGLAPLPPLPGDRMASLMMDGDRRSKNMAIGARASYMTPQMTAIGMAAANGFGNSLPSYSSAMGASRLGLLQSRGNPAVGLYNNAMNAASAAAAAEYHIRNSFLQGEATPIAPITPSNTLNAAAAAEYRLQATMLGSFPNHPSTSNLASSLYCRRSSMPDALAPRSFQNDGLDEVSSANHRLMERLLDHVSYPNNETLLGHGSSHGGSVAPPAAVSLRESITLQQAAVATSSSARRESITLQQAAAAASSSARRESFTLQPAAAATSSSARRESFTLQPAAAATSSSARRESFTLQQAAVAASSSARRERFTLQPAAAAALSSAGRESFTLQQAAAEVASSSARRESFTLQQAAVAALSSARRESFTLPQPSWAAATPSLSSLMRDLSGYNMPPTSHANFLPSSLPSSLNNMMSGSRSQGFNVATVANAMRDAQRLEDLTRSRRATASALAGALQQNMGGQDPLTLALGQLAGQKLNFDRSTDHCTKWEE